MLRLRGCCERKWPHCYDAAKMMLMTREGRSDGVGRETDTHCSPQPQSAPNEQRSWQAAAGSERPPSNRTRSLNMRVSDRSHVRCICMIRVLVRVLRTWVILQLGCSCSVLGAGRVVPPTARLLLQRPSHLGFCASADDG